MYNLLLLFPDEENEVTRELQQYQIIQVRKTIDACMQSVE